MAKPPKTEDGTGDQIWSRSKRSNFHRTDGPAIVLPETEGTAQNVDRWAYMHWFIAGKRIATVDSSRLASETAPPYQPRVVYCA